MQNVSVKVRNVDPLLTRKEAAEFLNVTNQWLAMMAFQNGGPKMLKLGKRQVRYRLSDLKSYIDASERVSV